MNNTPNQNLVDAVRTLGQLLLTNGIAMHGALDRHGNWVSARSKQAFRFSYFAALQVLTSKFRSRMKYREFWVHLDETCDQVLGKTMFSDIWEEASVRTRKRWATKLANYTGE